MINDENIIQSNDDAFRLTSGVHFTSETVAASSKSSIEKCTGRTIIDLGKTVLKHVKKTVIIVEEWLTDGQLTTGQSWEDLYAHVIDVHKKKIFIGFMAFICLIKYNDGGINKLNVLEINDDDIKNVESGRGSARKKAKLTKDDTRDISAGYAISPFASRGLSVEARVQVIEVAQFETQKIREDFKHKIDQLNHKADLLLRERSQQIELAKIICPVYDTIADV